MQFKKNILSILFIVAASFTFAQGKFYAKGASTCGIDESYKVIFVLENADGRNFKAPSFEGFKILSGPNQSTSYQNYNGKITNSVSIYYYLEALKEGPLTIGSASVEINGSKVYTEAISVEILPAKAKNPPPNQAQQNQNKQQNNQQNTIDWQKDAKNNIFVRLYTDNSNPYVGEQIFVYAKLYLRVDTYGSRVNKMPDFQGFWKEEIEVNQDKPAIEEYNGVRYNTFWLAKYALFPLKEGKYTLDPIDMTSLILVSTPTIEDFFGMKIRRMGYEQVEYNHKSNALVINAKALPTENKPLDFSGAVGSFKLSTSLDSTVINFGSPLKYTTTISGTGNIMSIQEPTIEFPRQLEVFDPVLKENISKTSNYINGTKSYQYIIVPERPGEFTIPEMSFSYFDLETESYKSLSSPSFDIKVNGELPQKLITEKEEETFENPYELNDIARNYDVRKTTDAFYGSALYYFGLSGPMLIYLFFILGSKLKENFQVDLVALKNKRASKEAQKRLKKAKEFLDKEDKQAFYNEIFTAFNGYVGDKFNIQQAELNKDLAVEKLKEKNIGDLLALQFTQVLINAEEALYSPASVSKMQEDYDIAIEWIVNVEHEIS